MQSSLLSHLMVEPIEGLSEHIEDDLYVPLLEVHEAPRHIIQSALNFALLRAVRIDRLGVRSFVSPLGDRHNLGAHPQIPLGGLNSSSTMITGSNLRQICRR